MNSQPFSSVLRSSQSFQPGPFFTMNISAFHHSEILYGEIFLLDVSHRQFWVLIYPCSEVFMAVFPTLGWERIISSGCKSLRHLCLPCTESPYSQFIRLPVSVAPLAARHSLIYPCNVLTSSSFWKLQVLCFNCKERHNLPVKIKIDPNFAPT